MTPAALRSPLVKRVLKAAAVVVGLVVAIGVVAAVLDNTPDAEVTRPRVPMPDGVRLAVDVVLPSPRPSPRVPVVLVQTRYWRSFELIFPDAPGKVPKGPREPIVEALVRAGFGVVVADVRGTGASEGVWQHPFGRQEVLDSAALIDWVVQQPFCDGRVGATGLSYEGTTALLSAATARPALKAVLARQLEWELADELIAPGGVRNLAFPEAWGRSVAALDRGEPPELFPAAARAIITSVHPTDEDPKGQALRALQRGRAVSDVARAVSGVRAARDAFGAGPPVSSLGPSAWADELKATTAAVSLWGGWWDGATGDAVVRASAAMPLTDAVIGPWTHEGTASASPFPSGTDTHMALGDVVAFFERHLKSDGPRTSRRRWYVAGAERWEQAAAWPATTPTTFGLAAGGRLTVGPEALLNERLTVDFGATTGVNNRWMSGMLRPTEYLDRTLVRGGLSWRSPPLEQTLSAFGAPRLQCALEVEGREAALHVYLEAVSPSGKVHLLTEGVQRVTTGAVEVRLRAVAFELTPGWALRVTATGADAPTFERVPADGEVALRLHSPCTLEVPSR